jgi:tetratricopeptide (TPR) repeat protein
MSAKLVDNQGILLEGRFGFIGRQEEIAQIERALRGDDSACVLLIGTGGIGKTELAYGFSRWYASRGACAGGVFATSFEAKADFGQVIASIVGHRTDFYQLPEEEQWQRLIGYLRQNPCLLIWDNFETVAGPGEGADPVATDEQRQLLSHFLHALSGGQSRIIITTCKTEEEWLGIPYERVEVGGLSPDDARQLAAAVLTASGHDPSHFANDPSYEQLLDLMEGHPRSIEILLPHLRSRSPAEIVHEIRQRQTTLQENIEEAAAGFAFAQMSSQARVHLPFLGLFVSRVSSGTVGSFVGSGDEQQQVYERLLGEALDADEWEAVLNEAGDYGLLQRPERQLYEMHSTLPFFLRSQLASHVGPEGVSCLEAEFTKFYSGLSAQMIERARGGDQSALLIAHFEEPNLLRALRHAERKEEWAATHQISRLLGELYKASARVEEWNALCDRLLQAVGGEISAEAGKDRAQLWLFLIGDEASQAVNRGELRAAEAAYQRILDYLGSHPELSDAMSVADLYYQLGLIAQRQQEFNYAEHWYKKALETYERLGTERKAARAYLQLGRLGQERQQFDQPEQWFLKALRILERLGSEQETAPIYFQLGIIAEHKHQFSLAEQRYRRALQTYERLDMQRHAAEVYSALGLLAQRQEHFDQAEQWTLKALETLERQGDPPLLVRPLAALGLLYWQQDQLSEAISWFGGALSIAAEYNLGLTRGILEGLAEIMDTMGEEEFAAAWRQAFQDQEPPLALLREVWGQPEG